MTRDFKKALELFKSAAERGNAEAQFNLGAMHIGEMPVSCTVSFVSHAPLFLISLAL